MNYHALPRGKKVKEETAGSPLTAGDIEFRIVYSGRRTIGISIKTDSSVIVRAPFRTGIQTIEKLVLEKASWIRKHRDYYISRKSLNPPKQYINGEKHYFKGVPLELIIIESRRASISFNENCIRMGLNTPVNSRVVKSHLYAGYKAEASIWFPLIMKMLIEKHSWCGFNPTALVVRTMKRRWGSCTAKGIITLNTELIKLSPEYAEYVIIHELCHLRHHNHGGGFYRLLSELYPEWKKAKKELQSFIQ